ncbi:MAG TPA: hypothetical protein VF604_00720 [Pyrinomonadaceae bacterium]|jgi:hypothetical protein
MINAQAIMKKQIFKLKAVPVFIVPILLSNAAAEKIAAELNSNAQPKL